MDKTPLFRWSGEYFGFIHNNRLFDTNSNYLGWVEDDGSVWKANGTYLGEIVEDNYILRNSMKMEPIPKIPKIPPIPPIPPIPMIDRIGKIGKISWEDALDQFRESA